MKKFAMIDNSGNIVSIISPSMDDYYTDGTLYGEQVAKEIPLDSNDVSYINHKYWREGFYDKPIKPNRHYIWLDYQWAFDSVGFWLDMRVERNLKLANSDWTQMADAKLTNAKKAEWLAYRQQLRDIPSVYAEETNIDNVVYPTRPEA
tara:strand:+ start:73 stop:516 length:444 start_codon:yes stop_codon:yes gene_type:complete